MKKFFLTLCLLISGTILYAATETVNDIEWTYQVVNGEVSITDCPKSTIGAITIPSTLGGYPVTSIGDNAFYGCSGLTAVTIPASVTSIGDYTFFKCENLTSVTIPSNVTSIGDYAFYYCSSLTSVTIPSSVTTIGEGAFEGCSKIWKDENGVQYESEAKVVLIDVPESMSGAFVIPNTVRFIHSSAFYRCSSLTSVTIPSSVTSIGDYAFGGCSMLWKDTKGVQYESEEKVVLIDVPELMSGSFVIPNTVRFIHTSAFYKCSSLTSVTIPEGVTSIGDEAFYDCSGLTSVTIPSSVTSIGGCTFSSCSGLTSVTILEGVTSIGSYTFEYCSNLTSVTIPEGVTTIGDGAFEGCSSLTSLTIPEGVTTIGDYAFYGCKSLTSVTIPASVTSIRESAFYGVAPTTLIAAWVPDGMSKDNLKTLTIPEGVTSIGDSAFSGYSGLTSVTIPSSVTSIGNHAFAGCYNLTAVTIPEGVTSIGDGSFYWCWSLTSITIPSSVRTIGCQAFEYCSGLTTVSIVKGLELIGPEAFAGCYNLTAVTIPDGVTSIGSSAFERCYDLTVVTIPASVTNIGAFAFLDCTSLTSFNVDSENQHYTRINDLLCSKDGKTLLVCPAGLTSVTIPLSVTSVEDYAFLRCSSLTSIRIPASVTEIGDGAFGGCSRLEVIDLADISVWCASHSPFLNSPPTQWELHLNGLQVTHLVIPEGTYSIGDYAFYGCTGLISITIPSTLFEVGFDAFQSFYWGKFEAVYISDLKRWCGIRFSDPGGNPLNRTKNLYLNGSSVRDLRIPSDVTFLSNATFYGCNFLTSVTIPEGVTSIGSDAFYNCGYLTSVMFEGAPPSCGDRCLENVPATGYYLPQYASEWEAVITGGKWNGLTMVQKEVATLPEGLLEVTGEWLTNLLETQDVTSGSVTLASGTTVDTLEAARLLGITPSVTRTDDGATVAAESTFEVSEVVVAENAVSLSVTITVEAGTLPSVLSLGGTVKLMVCDTLGGEWTEVTPDPSQIKLTRVSENKATLSVTQDPGSYKFFQVLVK